MSGVSSSTSSGASTFGTNVAPISFPGISSGIDYNSIIQKYVNLTLQQEKPLQTKVTALNAQQSELLKIQDLLSTFQDSFTAVSDPANFNATTATASTSGVATFTDVAGQTAAPGTYTIQSATMATSTQLVGSAAAGAPLDTTKSLQSAGFEITPQNGVSSSGSTIPATLTIDGVQLTIDVTSFKPADLVNAVNNNAQLQALGVTAAFNPDGTFSLSQTSAAQPLTIGSAGDVGNLVHALKLDTAGIVSGGGVQSITSAGPVGGINLGSTFSTNNNAGFATAVTSGSFTINGVQITVDGTNGNLHNVIDAINSSSAGVTASYDPTTGRVALANKATGSQGIVLGSASDSSNFLQAAGFLQNFQTPGTLAAGAQQSVGQPAHVTYLDPSGQSHTAFSASNDVTNVIPGIDIKLLQSTSTPYTVNVAQDSGKLQTAIKTFVDAYNAVIDEINTATAAPVVSSTTDSSTGQQVATDLTKGGVLFNDQDVLSLRDQLVNLISTSGSTGSSSFNSLSAIGLTLDSSFSVATAGTGSSKSGDSSNAPSVSNQTFDGTSGRLQSLDVTKFTSALSANPSAVSKLFVGKTSLIGQLGAYLTGVTGLPTQLTGGLAGAVPQQSLFNTLTADAADQVTSLQKQITLITTQANMQADQLRAEFVDSEKQIAQLQSMQSSLGALSSGGK